MLLRSNVPGGNWWVPTGQPARRLTQLGVAAIRVFLGLVLAFSLVVPVDRTQAQVKEGATLTVLRGQVAVIRTDGSAIQPAPSGTDVYPNDEIRTITESGALITFFAGTEIELGENTVLVVERVSRDGAQLHVALRQVYGVSINRVAALADTGSSYQIQAGGVVGLVRGTGFALAVAPPFAALGCAEGIVAIGIADCRPGRLFKWEFDPSTGARRSAFTESSIPAGDLGAALAAVLNAVTNMAERTSANRHRRDDEDDDENDNTNDDPVSTALTLSTPPTIPVSIIAPPDDVSLPPPPPPPPPPLPPGPPPGVPPPVEAACIEGEDISASRGNSPAAHATVARLPGGSGRGACISQAAHARKAAAESIEGALEGAVELLALTIKGRGDTAEGAKAEAEGLRTSAAPASGARENKRHSKISVASSDGKSNDKSTNDGKGGSQAKQQQRQQVTGSGDNAQKSDGQKPSAGQSGASKNGQQSTTSSSASSDSKGGSNSKGGGKTAPASKNQGAKK